jgi:Undecaprenyl-phosphate galactose phosphotransferase WbaP
VEQRLTTEQLTLVPANYQRLQDLNKGRLRPRGWQHHLAPAALILTDFSLSLLILGAAAVLKGMLGNGASSQTDVFAISQTNVFAMAAVITSWVGLRGLLGLYPGYGLDSVEHLRRHTYATFATLAILAIFALGFQLGSQLSRLLLALVFLGLLVLAPCAQNLIKWWMRKMGLWGKPVMILGYKEAGANVVDVLKRNWGLGYVPVAIFDYRLDVSVRMPSENADSGQALFNITDYAHNHGVDTVIFAMPHIRREQLAKLVDLASLSFRHVLVIPNLSGVVNSAVMARDLAGTFAVEVKYNLLNPWALRTKRVADLMATMLGGMLVLPLLLMLAVVVYIESGRPVFYRDQRMGRDGERFSCLKFRTMMPEAEALLQHVLEGDARLRSEYMKYHKLRDDPRITRVGRFLRRTSLDELPQIWNVLRGEMSLVGPRPYLPRESQEIGLSQSQILRVPPGITGPWQVSGRSRMSFGERVEMDNYYVRDWSIWLDIVLLARTVRILLLDRDEAY